MSTIGFFANAREYLDFNYGSIERFLEELDLLEIEEIEDMRNHLPAEVFELEEVRKKIIERKFEEWNQGSYNEHLIGEMIKIMDTSKLAQELYETNPEFLMRFIGQVTKAKDILSNHWEIKDCWFENLNEEDNNTLIQFVQRYQQYYLELPQEILTNAQFFYEFKYTKEFLSDKKRRFRFEKCIGCMNWDEPCFYQWLKTIIEACPVIYAECSQMGMQFGGYESKEEEEILKIFLLNYKLTNPELDKIYFRDIEIFFSDDEDKENVIYNLIRNFIAK